MQCFLEAGTDAACVALFDPAALPSDERRWEDDPINVARALQTQGRIFFTETGADGAYAIAVYVGEAPPPYLKPYLCDPIEIASFHVPSGRLCFCGGEDIGPGKWPKSGRAEIPSGVYSATFWRGNYPQEMVEDLVQSRLGKARHSLETAVGTLNGVCILASVVLLAALCGSGFAPWAGVALAVAVTLAVAGIIVLRLPYFQRIAADRREVEQWYPPMVCEFRLVVPQR